MKSRDTRDTDEFGLPIYTEPRHKRPRRTGRKSNSDDDWWADGRKKKDKPWRGKKNRGV